MKKLFTVFLLISGFLIIPSCDDTNKNSIDDRLTSGNEEIVYSDTEESVSGYGKIIYTDIEGGHYLIRHNEKNYEPINLDDEFRIEGFEVIFSAKIKKDMASICMCGTIIEIIEIRKAE
jgi:hypothetical protein